MSDFTDLMNLFAPKRSWPGAAGTICQALGLAGLVTKVGGKDAFLLDGDDVCWLVLSGSLDLFYLSDGPTPASQGINGIRNFVARIDQGAGAFGLLGGGQSILAVPASGTEIVTVKRQAVLDLAQPGQDQVVVLAVREIVETWVNDLAVHPDCLNSPRDALVVTDGSTYPVEPKTTVVPAMHTVMVELKRDDIVLSEAEASCLQNRDSFVDIITNQWWILVKQPFDLTPITIAAWLERPDCGADLDVLHARVLVALALKVAMEKSQFIQRSTNLREHEQTIFGRSLRSLVGIIPGNGGVTASLPNHPLAAAFTLICRNLRQPLNLPQGFEGTLAKFKDQVDGLAHMVGLQVREIHLTHEWWRRDFGPILVFGGPNRQPMAALPRGPSAYTLTDPVSGQSRTITAEIAKTINAGAYVVQPALPPGKVTPGVAFRFAAIGRGREGVNILVTVLLNALVGLVPPVVTGWIMDPVIPQGELDQLGVLITALVIAGIAGTGFSLIQSIAMIRLEGGMEQRLQSAVWDRLLKLPASFFRNFSVGDLANRAQGIDSMRQMLTGAVTSSFMTGISGLFSLGLMMFYNWKLGLVTAVIGIIYGILAYLVGRRILSRNRELMKLTGSIQGIVLQLLSGVSRLRVAGAERAAFSLWANRYSTLLTAQFGQAQLANMMSVFKTVFNYLAFVAILTTIGLSSGVMMEVFHQPTDWKDIGGAALQKVFPVGNFIAFNAAYGQFLGAVFAITQTAIQLINLKPLYERVEPILSAQEESDESSREDPGEIEGEIEVREAFFRYRPELPLVLNGLTLRAESGQFVALVGPSGAGKSSLIRLLLGFDQPERGSVFIDGKDLRTLDKRALRRNYGVVLQNGRVLAGSIFHNITAGANLTREDAWEAARLAGFDRDIEQMPMGMDTFLSEGATTISGGQRQRLMIARAVVRRPRVLIFDEATSALDNETQAIVSRGLETLKCTRVVIAHRLSTVIAADNIFVVDKGQVVENGSHEQLMAMGGIYSDLARRQIV